MAKITKREELNSAFIAALAADWENNGSDVITALRVTRPEIYAQLIGKLVPTKIETETTSAFDSMTGDELENWLVNSFASDIPQAERIIAKARELATSGDPIVTILPDDEPSPAAPSRPKGRRPGVPVV